MTDSMERPAEMLGRLGRNWGWVFAYGVLTFLVGLAVLVWPSQTLLVLAVLFGLQLIISGIFRFVAALAVDDLTGGTRVLLALLGVLSIIIGLWALRHVVLTLLALVVFLGIYWIISGVVDIFMALGHRGTPERGWTVFTGVLGVIAGIIVLAWPAPTLLVLAIVLGIWLVIFGVMEMVAAYRLRQVGQGASRLLPTGG